MVYDLLTSYFFLGGGRGLCTSSYCLTEHDVVEAGCSAVFRQGKHVICQILYSPIPEYNSKGSTET